MMGMILRVSVGDMTVVRQRDHFHARCPWCEQLVGDVHRSITAEYRVAALEHALSEHRCPAPSVIAP